MAYRNSEGYKDPTAGEAMGNIMREYRAQRRQTWRRQYELRCRSKVYIVSRYAGDGKQMSQPLYDSANLPSARA